MTRGEVYKGLDRRDGRLVQDEKKKTLKKHEAHSWKKGEPFTDQIDGGERGFKRKE